MVTASDGSKKKGNNSLDHKTFNSYAPMYVPYTLDRAFWNYTQKSEISIQSMVDIGKIKKIFFIEYVEQSSDSVIASKYRKML